MFQLDKPREPEPPVQQSALINQADVVGNALRSVQTATGVIAQLKLQNEQLTLQNELLTQQNEQLNQQNEQINCAIEELSHRYAFTYAGIEHALQLLASPLSESTSQNVLYILEQAAIGIATDGAPAHAPEQERAAALAEEAALVREVALDEETRALANEITRINEIERALERERDARLAEEERAARLAQDERFARLTQETVTADEIRRCVEFNHESERDARLTQEERTRLAHDERVRLAHDERARLAHDERVAQRVQEERARLAHDERVAQRVQEEHAVRLAQGEHAAPLKSTQTFEELLDTLWIGSFHLAERVKAWRDNGCVHPEWDDLAQAFGEMNNCYKRVIAIVEAEPTPDITPTHNKMLENICVAMGTVGDIMFPM